jgi:uncharacterized protein YukE
VPRRADAKEFAGSEITTFDDIPNKFLLEYSFTDCPLSSFRGLSLANFPNVRQVHTRNALFASFKDCLGDIPKLSAISLVGLPVTEYPLYRTMAVLAFGYQVAEIDGAPVDQKDAARIREVDRDGSIARFVRHGGVLRTFDGTTAKTIEQLTVAPPPLSLPTRSAAAGAAFSPFFDAGSIRSAEARRMAAAAATPRFVLEVATRSCFADFRVLFSALDDETRVAPFFAEFGGIAARLPPAAQLPRVLAAIGDFRPLLAAKGGDIARLLGDAQREFRSAASELSKSQFARFCGGFVGTCRAFVAAIGEIVTEGRDFDALYESRARFDALADERAAPFRAVVEDITARVDGKRALLSEPQFNELSRKLSVANRCPQIAHFVQISELLKGIEAFKEEIEMCVDLVAEFASITHSFSAPPTGLALRTRIEDIKRQMTTQMMGLWAWGLKAAFQEIFDEWHKEAKEAQSAVHDICGRTNQLTEWVNSATKSFEGNHVYENFFGEMSLHCESFTKQRLQERKRDIQRQIEETQKEADEMDVEIRRLERELA